jgi:EmrB/QacA subfamily drug resistance transporter
LISYVEKMESNYRRWLAVLGICLASAVQPINFSLVTIAMPTIQKELSASLLQLQWMLNMFGIVISIFLVTMGRLADTFGRKKLFLLGILGAALSSCTAGFAIHPGMVIAAQGMMGFAGSILMPVSQALISHAFPDEERGKAIGIWATMVGLALSVGPFVGGTLISLLGWRSIFLINVPLLLCGLGLVLKFVDESKSVAHRGQTDIPGLIVLAIAIGSIALGIVQGPVWGWNSIATVSLLTLFVISLITLIFIERKAPFAIIHPHYFLHPTFLLASLCNFCMIFFLWAGYFLIPLYLQIARGDSPFTAGVIMLLIMGPLALFSSAVGKLHAKRGARVLLTGGFIALFISLIFQYQFEPSSGILLTAAGCLSFGIGVVLILGPSTTAAISALPKDTAATASGGFTTVQEIGGTIGLTIVGTVFRIGNPEFMAGFRYGLWILLGVVVLGLIASLCLKENRPS